MRFCAHPSDTGVEGALPTVATVGYPWWADCVSLALRFFVDYGQVGRLVRFFYSHTFGMLFTRCGLPMVPGLRALRLPQGLRATPLPPA